MKVLIETVTNRKGYKNFNDIDSLSKFLNENRKKIKSFKILKEAYDEHQNRKYQDTLTKDYSDYNNNQHENSKNDQLIKWYLLTRGGRR